MASLNKVTLIGYLGDEPKVEQLQNGARKVTLSVATTDKGFTTKSGAVVPDRTDWHRIIFWEKLAELCEKYLHKGSSVYIEGQLRNRSWDDKNGLKHFTTEIDGNRVLLLDKKPQGSGVPATPSNAPQTPETAQETAMADDGSVDLPF